MIRARSRPLVSFLVFSALAAPSALAGPKVLVVGDSHSTGTFKDGLLSVLDGQPDLRTAVYAGCGSSPAGWFAKEGKTYRTTCGYFERSFDGRTSQETTRSVPDFANLVATARPDVVVVAMGTNLYRGGVGAAKDSVRKMMKTAQAQGARCVWVGPPRVGFVPAAKQGEFYAMFEQLAREEKCKLLDSRPHTDVANLDRLKAHHPGKPGRRWGEVVGGEVLTFVRESGATAGSPRNGSPNSARTGRDAI